MMISDSSENEPLRVLIINDSPEMSEQIQNLLSAKGFEVLSASNNAQILETVETEKPDCVVSGVFMLGMEGFEICRRLKSHYSTRHIPIIFTSALPVREQDFAAAFAAGVEDYLEIPQRLQELPLKISKFTTHAQREKSILENELQYLTVAQNQSVIFFIINHEGFFEMCEGAGLEKINLLPEQVVGQNINDVYNQYPQFLDYIRRALAGESLTITGEFSGRFFDVTYNPLFASDSTCRGTHGIAIDVTERVAAEHKAAEVIAQLGEAVKSETLINRVSKAVRKSLQVEDVFATAVDELGTQLAIDRSQIFLLNEANDLLRIVAQFAAPGTPPISELDIPAAHVEELSRKVVREGLLAIDDVRAMFEDGIAYRQILQPRKVQSLIIAPIRVRARVTGFITLVTVTRQRKWSRRDVELARAVADQVGIAINQSELFELTRRAKREWETTFDAMSDGIFIFDQNEILRRINYAGALIENGEPHDLIGRHSRDLRLTGGRDSGVSVVRQVIEKRAKITIEKQLAETGRPLLITSEPIFDDDNELSGVVVTERDLYELRAAEAVARERHSLLTRVLAGIPEPIFAVAPDGKILWCNNATAETYNLSTDEITRRNFAEMVNVEDRQMAMLALQAALEKLPQSHELRFVKSGAPEIRYAVFNSVPLTTHENTSSVLWFMRDITSQKLSLQQTARADKLRALGQLASGVAHDFNNVLAAILGRVSLLRRQYSDEVLQRGLQIIQTSAEDAAATVRRIQSFASQSSMDDFKLIGIADLLRDAVEITRTRWENEALSCGVNYTVEVNADGEFHVNGSASELREVFVNLIVNALDAMPGGGWLHINCEAAGGSVKIKFADQGGGMSEEICERVFEPFFSTKGVNGMGLGLSVSYGIVERHQGRIGVTSQIGSGTIFTVTIPLEEAPRKIEKIVKSAESKKRLSVLVVDDEEFVREALMEMLTELSHDVTGADGAMAALQIMHSNRFDVVFTDLSMPQMDGWELARTIRHKWQATKTILVTGYGKGLPIVSNDQDLVHAIIGKPFNFEQLSEALDNVTA